MFLQNFHDFSSKVEYFTIVGENFEIQCFNYWEMHVSQKIKI